MELNLPHSTNLLKGINKNASGQFRRLFILFVLGSLPLNEVYAIIPRTILLLVFIHTFRFHQEPEGLAWERKYLKNR